MPDLATAALGAAAALAGAYVLDDQVLGIRRDLRTLNAAKFSQAFVERELAAGRISNVERFLLHAKAKPDEEYLCFQENPGSGPEGIVRYTWRETDEESSRIAHYLLKIGVKPGDLVASLYQNTPEFVFFLLGAWKIGCGVAFQNYNQRGKTFSHSFSISGSKVLFFEPRLADIVAEVHEELLAKGTNLVCYSASPIAKGEVPFPCTLLPSSELRGLVPATDIPKEMRAHLTMDSIGCLIYTSGTTGLPKAAVNSMGRMLGGYLIWIAQGIVGPQDRPFVVAPLFHSGAFIMLQLSWILGTPFICTRKFSASQFTKYATETGGTTFHYVGELIRYIALSPPSPYDRKHKIRSCLGNGIRADVWEIFQKRFGPFEIAELYGSTEGNGTSFTLNVWNKPGMVGYWGPLYRYMAKETRPRLFKIDLLTEELVRGPDGFCIEVGAGEPGEMLGRMLPLPGKESNWDGYYGNPDASKKKIVKDVLAKGDTWIRTGDLLVRDWRGWVNFVDRIGDTYRWKGENVSTFEVRDTLMESGMVEEANVYGVQVPNNLDGRAGMAAIVLRADLRARPERIPEAMRDLGRDMRRKLPPYAVPRFIRLKETMDEAQTVTFKHRKLELQNDGFDPSVVKDPLWFLGDDGYVPLDRQVYGSIVGGKAKL
ncbi:hypothetical protein DFJ74DRAFT_636784 [Hyaloraphidium curvatum]|nr:hypothetical protein DFJ74DRAFT_636784 [Hyaloraphidium curvatum]